jgi:energy-coupling factor transporter transmembrane protein EcfT
MQTSTSKLPVSAILLAMFATVIGGILGALFGGLIGSLLASAMHVPAREGESGYFIIFVGLIAIGIVTPASVLLTLYWRGVRKWWLLLGLIIAFTGIAGVGAAGFGIWYMAQPHLLNANGPTPRLEFEVKPPDGASLGTLADVRAELDTDRNVMPADWNNESGDRNSGARGGAVDLAFRTSQRLFVLKFPDSEDRVFKLRLPANPMRTKYREWSGWQRPDFVAKPGSQPSRAEDSPNYQIRYRVDYQE